VGVTVSIARLVVIVVLLVAAPAAAPAAAPTQSVVHTAAVASRHVSPSVPTAVTTAVAPAVSAALPTAATKSEEAVTRHPALQPLSRPVVVLYGDSLAWESRDDFALAFAGHPGVQLVVRTFGGTAICDWLSTMAQDAATLRPGAVVVEFSGNALTPCMQDAAGTPLSGDAYFQRYGSDAEAVVTTFLPTGAQLFFAGAPISRSASEQGDFRGGRLNTMYAQVAAAHDGVGYVDAGAAVLDAGRWTASLPCLAFEPCTGGLDASGRAVNIVRAPDGGHFCPVAEKAVRGVTSTCPVWSSGAFRYGSALARPVVDRLPA
jgi:hypothetical protein